LLAETFFIALAMAALIILLWRDKPGVRRVALVGLLFAVASVTRSVAITILPVIVMYLAIRRIGWRQIAAFILAACLGIGLYAAWFDGSHDEWGLTGYSGRFLWARTTTF